MSFQNLPVRQTTILIHRLALSFPYKMIRSHKIKKLRLIYVAAIYFFSIWQTQCYCQAKHPAQHLSFPYFWDYENSNVGLVLAVNAKTHYSPDKDVPDVEKLGQFYLWLNPTSIIYTTDSNDGPFGIYINRRQHGIARDDPKLSNLSFGFHESEGYIKGELIAPTAKSFSGSNNFEIKLSDHLTRKNPDAKLDGSGMGCWDLSSDGYHEFIISRNAVGHDFFGHPLMLRFYERDGDWGQLLAGMVTNPLDPPVLPITKMLFSIDPKFLKEAFSNGLKSLGKMPGELQPLVRNLSGKEFSLSVHTWSTISDIRSAMLSGDRDRFNDAYRLARELTDVLNNRIDEDFSTGPTVLLDPMFRGICIDHLTRFDDAQMNVIHRLRRLSQLFPNSEMAFALASASYSLGIGAGSNCYFELHRFAKGELKPEIRAAIGAHWHLPVKESEIDAVVETLKTALLPSVRSEAIDVLVLLGQIDKAPADRMAAWTDDNLFKAEPKLLRRKLAYLMKTKSGRDYLRGQMTNPAMSAETLEVVKAVITKHVEATKKLKRFDMISEEEVAELEKAISG